MHTIDQGYAKLALEASSTAGFLLYLVVNWQINASDWPNSSGVSGINQS